MLGGRPRRRDHRAFRDGRRLRRTLRFDPRDSFRPRVGHCARRRDSRGGGRGSRGGGRDRETRGCRNGRGSGSGEGRYGAPQGRLEVRRQGRRGRRGRRCIRPRWSRGGPPCGPRRCRRTPAAHQARTWRGLFAFRGRPTSHITALARTLRRGRGRGRGGLLRRFALGGNLLLDLGLLGLNRTAQAFGIRLAADPVGLSIFDGRGVALDADSQRDAEVQGLLIGQPELTAQFVDADLLCQLVLSVLRDSDSHMGCRVLYSRTSGALSDPLHLSLLSSVLSSVPTPCAGGPPPCPARSGAQPQPPAGPGSATPGRTRACAQPTRDTGGTRHTAKLLGPGGSGRSTKSRRSSLRP